MLCKKEGSRTRSRIDTVFVFIICSHKESIFLHCRSQWPRGPRRTSAAARLLRSWVWITLGVWMFVCCECCVLSGRGLCDELIPRPEESFRLWYVAVCDLETLRMRRPWPALGPSATPKKKNIYICFYKIDMCFFFQITYGHMAECN